MLRVAAKVQLKLCSVANANVTLFVFGDCCGCVGTTVLDSVQLHIQCNICSRDDH